MGNTNDRKVVEFLKESNNIENIFDDTSLADAVLSWEYVIKQPVLDIPTILKTHKLLMKNQPINDNERGYFRKRGVMIGGTYGLIPAMIPEMIANWTKLANRKDVDKEALKRIHVLYEDIHPFIDGNGRTGRIFMNWQRLRMNLPILIIYAKEKHQYYSWFQ
jgi:Fic family protein